MICNHDKVDANPHVGQAGRPTPKKTQLLLRSYWGTLAPPPPFTPPPA